MQYEQEAVVQFLATHRPQLAALIEQAYQQVGGHYARLSPEERVDGVARDTAELITDLSSDMAHLPISAPPAIVADVLKMVSTLETLVVAYVQTELSMQPELRRELTRRMQLATTRFRMKLSTQHLGEVQQAIGSPRPDDPGSAR